MKEMKKELDKYTCLFKDRVLKKGGTFCGCFYIQGGCKRTDWFIRNLYEPKG